MDYLSVTPKTGARCEHPVRHPRLKRISECVLPGGHSGAHQHLEATLVRWAELDQARIAELEDALQDALTLLLASLRCAIQLESELSARDERDGAAE